MIWACGSLGYAAEIAIYKNIVWIMQYFGSVVDFISFLSFGLQLSLFVITWKYVMCAQLFNITCKKMVQQQII